MSFNILTDGGRDGEDVYAGIHPSSTVYFEQKREIDGGAAFLLILLFF